MHFSQLADAGILAPMPPLMDDPFEVNHPGLITGSLNREYQKQIDALYSNATMFPGNEVEGRRILSDTDVRFKLSSDNHTNSDY